MTGTAFEQSVVTTAVQRAAERLRDTQKWVDEVITLSLATTWDRARVEERLALIDDTLVQAQGEISAVRGRLTGEIPSRV